MHNNRFCEAGIQDLHLLIGGLPCQPFSSTRQKNGTTERTSAPEQHPDWKTVCEEFEEFLESLFPAMFLVEEVMTFHELVGPDGKGTYLTWFVKRVSKLGYSVRVLKLDHCTWVSFPRPRLSLKTYFAPSVGFVRGGPPRSQAPAPPGLLRNPWWHAFARRPLWPPVCHPPGTFLAGSAAPKLPRNSLRSSYAGLDYIDNSRFCIVQKDKTHKAT